MKNKQIKIKELQLKQKELEIEDRKYPKRKVKIIDFPCKLGGRVLLEMEEGYTKKDLNDALQLLWDLVKTCTIYKELTPKEIDSL